MVPNLTMVTAPFFHGTIFSPAFQMPPQVICMKIHENCERSYAIQDGDAQESLKKRLMGASLSIHFTE